MSGKAYLSVLAAVVVAAGAAVFLLNSPRPTGAAIADKDQPSLLVYCAAGLKKPVEHAAKQFESEEKARIELQYGGTATLLTQVRLANAGDLFVAADQGSLEEARKAGTIAEVIPLVRQRPVLAVAKGNPLGLHTLEDLYRPNVKVAVANPEAASIGKRTRKAFGADWERFSKQVTVTKPTVTDIASDLSIGAVDAAIIWNSTVPQFKNIEAVEIPELAACEDIVSVAVLTSAKNPTRALEFARYLAAPEKGGKAFHEMGFEAIAGDAWEKEPTMLVYSGGVNRLSIESLLNQFAKREGAKITTVYNGCGVLCASMKAMEKSGSALPDAYYACDISFVPPVATHFPEVLVLTETHVGILVKKGNPFGIKTVADLSKKGLRLGLCNAKQSSLGYLTEAILHSCDVFDAVRKNVVVETPTADFLVNQMRADGLDACIVYAVNAAPQAAHLDFISIDNPGAVALQPYGISAQSTRRQLAERLLNYFKAHRGEFESAGFIWRGDGKMVKSTDIPDHASLKVSQ
jgi:molybdate transport system substrate-binding protein